jgi:hypothetical protein
MSQKSIEAMVERWMADEEFRQALKADPVGTAEREGYDLSVEEKAQLPIRISIRATPNCSPG